MQPPSVTNLHNQLGAQNAHNGHGHSHGGNHGHSHGNHGHSHDVPTRESFPFSLVFSEIRKTVLHRDSRRISALFLFNAASLALCMYWCTVTDSIGWLSTLDS